MGRRAEKSGTHFLMVENKSSVIDFHSKHFPSLSRERIPRRPSLFLVCFSFQLFSSCTLLHQITQHNWKLWVPGPIKLRLEEDVFQRLWNALATAQIVLANQLMLRCRFKIPFCINSDFAHLISSSKAVLFLFFFLPADPGDALLCLTRNIFRVQFQRAFPFCCCCCCCCCFLGGNPTNSLAMDGPASASTARPTPASNRSSSTAKSTSFRP